MEHRYSERSPQIIEVCLRHPGLGVLRARTVNISLGGMLLAVNHPRLAVNALVGLSFYLGSRRRRKQYHVQAMVTHCGPSGIGLMFDDRDDELHKALLDFITDQNDRPENRSIWDTTRPVLTGYR